MMDTGSFDLHYVSFLFSFRKINQIYSYLHECRASVYTQFYCIQEIKHLSSASNCILRVMFKFIWIQESFNNTYLKLSKLLGRIQSSQ